jgi:carbon-monoxide dehydrogenase small subunit
MIMTAAELLERNPHPSADEVRAGLAGNICRCTGYQNIVKSILAASEKMGGHAHGNETGGHTHHDH